ncbi:oxidoreductase [Ectobacillus antri]|uniref:Oxidoreductase n=1 Tax=Ectobacillus antri TaxID=2486280 RepID=A0ABT6H5S5_9BACI|nr:oxidoreductase [Ectobacillus antri]MDG4657129.1 oxidoreductase [Ectobacillus antri]MDG5754588.1 oxidoreductase [Ectobacillus antri]
MKSIKTALVGYGFSGVTFHAPFLQAMDEFDVIKVVSSSPEKVKQDFSEAEVVPQLEDALRDPNVELVVITTPNTLHYDMAKQSILAGKHVIIEKPMVVEPVEAEELIALAKVHGVMLSVYQNRRWDNDFLTIKQLLAQNKLGDVMTYEAHFDRFRPQVRDRWREREGRGTGILYDLGSHLIDQALHLFGMPQFVVADVTEQREGAQTDDYFHIVMGYGKRRVILHVGSIVPGQGPKFLVHGTKASYIKYGLDGQEDALKAGKNPLEQGWGADRPEWYGKLLTEETEEIIETVPGSYSSYYQGVYEHIRGGAQNPVPGEDGLRTIQVIRAALTSSIEKRFVYMDGEVRE